MPVDPKRVLNLQLDPGNESGASTVRGYLTELLLTLWREEAGFSGKRPFGMSGWQYDLYVPLMKAGLITGSLDEDGYVEDCDAAKGDEIILAAIREMCRA